MIIEAFARGRGVVATGAGGVLDLVENGVEGILIAPADTDALVTELVRVLSDRDARGPSRRRRLTPGTPTGTRRRREFARQMREPRRRDARARLELTACGSSS